MLRYSGPAGAICGWVVGHRWCKKAKHSLPLPPATGFTAFNLCISISTRRHGHSFIIQRGAAKSPTRCQARTALGVGGCWPKPPASCRSEKSRRASGGSSAQTTFFTNAAAAAGAAAESIATGAPPKAEPGAARGGVWAAEPSAGRGRSSTASAARHKRRRFLNSSLQPGGQLLLRNHCFQTTALGWQVLEGRCCPPSR